jgi:hypothetical protein
MIVSRNTIKTVTLEAEPGDRILVDDNGFGIQDATFKWDGNTDLRNRLIMAIKRLKNAPDFGAEMSAAWDDKNEAVQTIINTLKIYKSKRVFVGFNY